MPALLSVLTGFATRLTNLENYETTDCKFNIQMAEFF